jgi:hypothetical protein
MAATVKIYEKNGAGETDTDKTSGTIRFKHADNATVDTSNPMVVPGAGSDWSYQKWLRLNITGTYTEISNLKFYTDGSNGFGTGVNLWAKTEATYATPAEETASTGYTDAFSYTSGSPLSLGTGPFTGTGDKGSYLKLALEVQSTASQGALSAESVTFAWDEI